ncbi:MAG TPA: hypothetical protein VK543_03670 [Puia sp.]|nr:hypothetical protein [Puia sp.]
MTEGKYLSLWTKYLPVIRILLKKSIAEEQQVALGKMELQFVDNRKNANYSFNLEIVKGKVENGIGGSPIGKDLFYVMNNDAIVKSFMNDKNIIIKMTRSSQLTFKSDLVVEEQVI